MQKEEPIDFQIELIVRQTHQGLTREETTVACLICQRTPIQHAQNFVIKPTLTSPLLVFKEPSVYCPLNSGVLLPINKNKSKTSPPTITCIFLHHSY